MIFCYGLNALKCLGVFVYTVLINAEERFCEISLNPAGRCTVDSASYHRLKILPVKREVTEPVGVNNQCLQTRL